MSISVFFCNHGGEKITTNCCDFNLPKRKIGIFSNHLVKPLYKYIVYSPRRLDDVTAGSLVIHRVLKKLTKCQYSFGQSKED